MHAHHKGNFHTSEEIDIWFENTEICRFKLSRKDTFEYLKERIQTKLQYGTVSQILYRNVVHFGNNLMKYVPLKIRDVYES